jgi:hypothetical protein
LVVINLDVEPSACGAKFRKQHITIEPVSAGSVDAHRTFTHISLDNQDWGINLLELCPEALLKLRGVVARPSSERNRLGVTLALLWNAVVEDPRHHDTCRFLGNHRADAGARGDLESQISAAAASADHDARSIDERKLAQVFDDREGVLDGIGGLGINITTAVGRADKDVAGCQEARTGGEIARRALETRKRHRSNATMKHDDREGPVPEASDSRAAGAPAIGAIV